MNGRRARIIKAEANRRYMSYRKLKRAWTRLSAPEKERQSERQT